MIAQIGSLLIDTAGGLLVFALLLRFTMQAVRAPFRNALGELVLGLSDWLVLPVRRPWRSRVKQHPSLQAVPLLMAAARKHQQLTLQCRSFCWSS